jgi:drug/metabolite transporter (DMT)-like permease
MVVRRGLSKPQATAIGFCAILMWALLALLSAASGAVPPFQLVAITFFIGGLIGIATWPFRGGVMSKFPTDWRVWVLGIAGLFGYHAVYFAAIRSAPAIEVSLVAYLWPLFIVVFSNFLPGEKLQAHHVVGVVLGLLGAVFVISKGQLFSVISNFNIGHALAFACALIWSSYSVLSRRNAHVSSDVVAAFCLVTAFLAFIAHLLFETTVWPASQTQWLAVLALGVVPLGLGFYAWDFGVKHGDIMVLGAASYAAPLLSTLVLVAAGQASLSWPIIIGCVAITAGALIAAKDMIFKKAI